MGRSVAAGDTDVRRHTGLLMPWWIVVVMALLSSCGGSGGDNSLLPEESQSDDQPPDTGSTVDDEAPAEGLPDFVVTDLVTSPVRDAGDDFSVSVTIANAGTAPGLVPRGWWMVSANPDFTTDYFHLPMNFTPQTPSEGLEIAPGEVQTFVASTLRFSQTVLFDLGMAGDYTARVWINPDLSARFENPEENVIESYEMPESDYSNNLSPPASFQYVTSSVQEGCQVDALEENDSLESATPIALDTRYDMNSCDDLSEVVVVDLVAGEDYELFDHYQNRDGPDPPRPTEWQWTVVDPNGRYLTRRAKTSVIVKARVSGPHHVIVSYPDYSLGDHVLDMEIISR